jgi:hypothetical protein
MKNQILTEKQIKYIAYYQANREKERMRKAKDGSPLHLIKGILNAWEKQGISGNYWTVYEKACNFIGRIPRTAFKMGRGVESLQEQAETVKVESKNDTSIIHEGVL